MTLHAMNGSTTCHTRRQKEQPIKDNTIADRYRTSNSVGSLLPKMKRLCFQPSQNQEKLTRCLKRQLSCDLHPAERVALVSGRQERRSDRARESLGRRREQSHSKPPKRCPLSCLCYLCKQKVIQLIEKLVDIVESLRRWRIANVY